MSQSQQIYRNIEKKNCQYFAVLSEKIKIKNFRFLTFLANIIIVTALKIYCTVFENHRKSLIQLASEASYVYILSGQKLI